MVLVGKYIYCLQLRYVICQYDNLFQIGGVSCNHISRAPYETITGERDCGSLITSTHVEG